MPVSLRKAGLITLLFICCAGGAFALGRSMAKSPTRPLAPVRFQPRTASLHVAASLRALPVLPALARHP